MVSATAYDDVRASQLHVQYVKTRVKQANADSADAIDAKLETLTKAMGTKVTKTAKPTAWPAVNAPGTMEQTRAARHHLDENTTRVAGASLTQLQSIRADLLTLITTMGGAA